MADFTAAAMDGAPVPDNLEDAIKEIYRLRQALEKSNARHGMIFEKSEMTKRSMAGQIKHYRELLGLE